MVGEFESALRRRSQPHPEVPHQVHPPLVKEGKSLISITSYIISSLTHTSGLVYGYVDALIRREILAPYAWKRMTLEHFVTALARLPLLFHPGTHAWYSVGFDVLGYV